MKSNLVTSRSDTEVEHFIYSTLKSKQMEPMRATYIREGLDFPKVVLTNCPILGRGTSRGLLTQTNGVEFSPDSQTITVCKNYLRSQQ